MVTEFYDYQFVVDIYLILTKFLLSRPAMATDEDSETEPELVRDLTGGGRLDRQQLTRIDANPFIVNDGKKLPVFTCCIYIHMLYKCQWFIK